MDIDPDVAARATFALNAIGYAGQVEVVTADARGPRTRWPLRRGAIIIEPVTSSV